MRIDLTIFDQAFVLECGTDQANRLKVHAKELDKQLRAAKVDSPRVSPERIAIMTALRLLQDNADLQQQLLGLQGFSLTPQHELDAYAQRLQTLTQQATQFLELYPIQSDNAE